MIHTLYTDNLKFNAPNGIISHYFMKPSPLPRICYFIHPVYNNNLIINHIGQNRNLIESNINKQFDYYRNYMYHGEGNFNLVNKTLIHLKYNINPTERLFRSIHIGLINNSDKLILYCSTSIMNILFINIFEPTKFIVLVNIRNHEVNDNIKKQVLNIIK